MPDEHGCPTTRRSEKMVLSAMPWEKLGLKLMYGWQCLEKVQALATDCKRTLRLLDQDWLRQTPFPRINYEANNAL